MKIIAIIHYNNSNLKIENFDVKTKLEIIIEQITKFIMKETPNIDYNNLIFKWSELENIKKIEGNISLRQLLRKNKRFKIGYGGYVRFEINYEKIEIFSNSMMNIEMSKDKLFFYFSVLSFLNNNEINIFSQVNKKFYYIVKNYFLLFQNFSFDNYVDKDKEKEKLLFEIKTNLNYNDFNFNILNFYQTEKNIYLLIQSQFNYNVEILKLSKENKTKEIIFADEWTNYFMFNNMIYQIKYNNTKSRINKLNENKEIKLIKIDVTTFDNFTMCFFYYFKKENRSYILSSNMCLYNINNKKGKLQLIINLSNQYKKFMKFSELCKIREYIVFYKFIDEYFFISLKNFYLYNIMNKRLLNGFPNLRGVENVYKLSNFFYIRNYKNIHLLSIKTYEILYTIKRYNTNICINNYSEIDANLNFFQLNQNNILSSKGEINIQKYFIKFDDDWYCYNYYNDDKYMTIFLIKKEKYKIIQEKKIQITMDKFIKNIEFKKETKEKYKREKIKKINPLIFMNGKGIIIINLGDNYYFFQKTNELFLKKIKRINLKTNLIFNYHNIIVTSKYFIIWTEASYKILVYEIKEDSEMKMLSMENIEDENENISLESPIFIFSKNDEIYLLSSYNSKYNSFLISKINISEDNIKLCENIEYHVILKSFLEKTRETIIFANFILQKKYLLIFSSTDIYLTKFDSISKTLVTIYKRELKIFGQTIIKQLNNSEFEYLVNEIKENKTYYFNFKKYIL